MSLLKVTTTAIAVAMFATAAGAGSLMEPAAEPVMDVPPADDNNSSGGLILPLAALLLIAAAAGGGSSSGSTD